MPIPMPQQPSAGRNSFIFGSTIPAPAFQKAAAPVDLQVIIDRGAAYSGVAKLKVLRNDEGGIGVVGFEIFQPQTGLTYIARYYDDHGNDACGLTVRVPQGRPYLHRAGEVCLAERGYVLALLHSLLQKHEPLLKSNLTGHLTDMRDACTRGQGVGLEVGAPLEANLRPLGRVVIHQGLSFPDDDDYKNSPDPAVMAMEWVRGQNHYLVDCSNWFPRFTVRDANNPHDRMMLLTKPEAKDALEFFKGKCATDSSLSWLKGAQGLWYMLEMGINFHDEHKRQPAFI
jgi:hypothetical protein